MKQISIYFFLIILSCTSYNNYIQQIQVIPQPNRLTTKSGNFKLNKVLLSTNSKSLGSIAKTFKTQVKNEFSVELKNSGNANVRLILEEPVSQSESYFLAITKNGIEIKANSERGIFYGLQTLRQIILFAEKENRQYILPQVEINDTPRFEWRGVMLDESRHFFGAEKVKQLIDIMSFYKLNKFHWHLTDVPGWRIEIKKYPKLTTVGGVGNFSNPEAPAQFYTQKQITEIINYAADRFIEIIPEIDMPGHATAANRAYPEFSGGGSKSHPDFTFNPGNEKTYGYLTDILKEVAALFPSEYIHFGGDEVFFGNEKWKTDTGVLKLMKKHNLKNLKDVESYFGKRMADSVKILGKTVIGWDEIVDHGLNPETSVVMWWRHNLPEKLNAALSGKYEVILCPRIPLYFDFVQHKSHKWGRRWAGAYSPLELVYAFPPDTLSGLKKYAGKVKGMQADIWTEQIQNNKRLDFMTYPRMSALAESAWTFEKNKDMNDFMRRLKPMLSFFEKKNIYYFNPFNPEKNTEPAGVNK